MYFHFVGSPYTFTLVIHCVLSLCWFTIYFHFGNWSCTFTFIIHHVLSLCWFTVYFRFDILSPWYTPTLLTSHHPLSLLIHHHDLLSFCWFSYVLLYFAEIILRYLFLDIGSMWGITKILKYRRQIRHFGMKECVLKWLLIHYDVVLSFCWFIIMLLSLYNSSLG